MNTRHSTRISSNRYIETVQPKTRIISKLILNEIIFVDRTAEGADVLRRVSEGLRFDFQHYGSFTAFAVYLPFLSSSRPSSSSSNVSSERRSKRPRCSAHNIHPIVLNKLS